MHALDVLGDPVRRRILELLADGEVAAGEVGRAVQAEFGISQPAVSQQLRVLRESGFATVRAEGTRRLYAIEPEPIAEAAQWFTPFERFWRGPLDALGTELARGARGRRRSAASAPPPHGDRDDAPAASPAQDELTHADTKSPTPNDPTHAHTAPPTHNDPGRAARSEQRGMPGPAGRAAASAHEVGAEASAHPRSRPSRPAAPERPERGPAPRPGADRTTPTEKEH